MGSKSDKIGTTPAQDALATYATNLMTDYRQRWLPVQQRLAGQIEALGKPDSTLRETVKGEASTDAAIKFGQADKKLGGVMANAGLNGSSRANLAEAGMNTDQAKSTGLGAAMTDQQIDDAYTKGLTALTSIGRGERANVNTGMVNAANMSGRQASADASNALAEHAGNAQLVGTAAGFGLQQAMNMKSTPNTPMMDSSGGYGGTGQVDRQTQSDAWGLGDYGGTGQIDRRDNAAGLGFYGS